MLASVALLIMVVVELSVLMVWLVLSLALVLFFSITVTPPFMICFFIPTPTIPSTAFVSPPSFSLLMLLVDSNIHSVTHTPPSDLACPGPVRFGSTRFNFVHLTLSPLQSSAVRFYQVQSSFFLCCNFVFFSEHFTIFIISMLYLDSGVSTNRFFSLIHLVLFLRHFCSSLSTAKKK